MKKLTTCLALGSVAALAPMSLVAQDAAPKPAVKVAEKDTVESIADLFLNEMHSLGNALKTVKDVETATAASANINKVTKNLLDLDARLQKLPVPDAATRKAINDKMDKKEAEFKKTMGEMPALFQKPEIGAALQESMMGFMMAMQKIQPTFQKYFEAPAEADTPAPPV